MRQIRKTRGILITFFGIPGPRAIVAGAVLVARAEGVSPDERDDLAVIEAHAVEDGADVVLVLSHA